MINLRQQVESFSSSDLRSALEAKLVDVFEHLHAFCDTCHVKLCRFVLDCLLPNSERLVEKSSGVVVAVQLVKDAAKLVIAASYRDMLGAVYG